MSKPADKVVSLAELRFEPANSNRSARALLAHQFVNVPHCCFARDDAISDYLAAETGMDAAPASPDIAAPADVDIPSIRGEAPETGSSGPRKLLRGGFALSIVLHAAAAVAIGYATLSVPDEPPLEAGTLSVTLVTQGNAEADARAAGGEQEMEEQDKAPQKVEVEPAEKTLPKPVAEEKPAPAAARQVLKDVPLPVLGADLPEILTTQAESTVETEAVAKTPIEEKGEKPVEDARATEVAEKPVAQKTEAKKEKAKQQPDKPKPREKRKQNRGDRGDRIANADKGDVDSQNKGKNATEARGDPANPEIGNAARTNYRGLVNRKLSRAKGRMQNPAKGKVTVTFTILADGTVSGLRIKKSSGKEALDATALKIVRNASPFPPIPAETGKQAWNMTVPMTFTGK